MKRTAVIILGLLCTAILGAQELTIGTIEGTSFAGPLVIKVLKEAGIKAVIVTYPQPENLYPALARGRVDGAFFLAQPVITQLNGAVMVPVRVHQTNFCALSLDPKVKVSQPGDLRKYIVGVVKDQLAHAALTRGMKTVTAANDAEQYKMLADGRIEVAIVVDMAVPLYAGMAGIKKYYLHNPPLMASPTFFALSRRWGSLEPKITPILARWVQSGAWQKELRVLEAEAAARR